MSKRIRIFGLVAVVLLALFAVAALDVHFGPGNALTAYKEELRAKGEKLDVAELIPPPVPSEQNGADTVREAIKWLSPSRSCNNTNPPLAMRIVAPGKAMIGWAQPDIRGYDATNTWAEEENDLGRDEHALQLLKQVMDRPNIDFQLDYKQGFTLPLLHLSKMKTLSLFLSVATIDDLHNGMTGSAVTNLLTDLSLVRDWHDEPLLISQLVRMAMAQITFNATWAVLQSTNLTDGQLMALQNRCEDLRFIEGFEKTLPMERARAEAEIGKLRASGGHVGDFFYGYAAGSGPASGGSSGAWLEDLKDKWEDTRKRGAEIMWLTSWSYTDELRALKGYEAYLNAVRSLETNRDVPSVLTDLTNQLTESGIDTGDDGKDFIFGDYGRELRRGFSELVSAGEISLKRVIKIETVRRITIAAIALKRFELKNRRYPATLAELAPDFLAAVPLDPMDGRPLRYRLNPDGTFLLYSIGEDGKDDGGDPSPVSTSKRLDWLTARDWVWPSPATSAEIEAYYTNVANSTH